MRCALGRVSGRSGALEFVMSRFAVHAVGRPGYESGVVAVLFTEAEANRVVELMNGYVHYDFRVAPESSDDTYLQGATLLESICYYAWEFPDYLEIEVTDSDRDLLSRACHIMAPVGTSGRESLEPAF